MRSPRRMWRAVGATAAACTAAAALTIVTQSEAAGAGTELDVVPRLQSWAPATGSFTLTSTSRLVVDAADSSATTSGVTGPFAGQSTLLDAVTSAAASLRSVTGLSLPVLTAGAPASGDLFFTLAADPARGTEGYTLTTGTASATVSAPTSTGAFYGAETIGQLLQGAAGHVTLPAGTGVDNPSLGYRAVSIDVARRFWSVAELKDEIRRMAWLKLNVLQLHFNEDEAFRLYSTNPAFSGLAPASASARYSQADIADLTAFADSLDVTVVPEIDTPAHAAAFVSVDPSRSLAQECGSTYADVLDITQASVRQWAESVYAEFLPWFNTPYFHIGNDEVPTSLNNCSYISGSGKTIQEWQTVYVNELDTVVKNAGSKTVMWANGSEILPATDITFVNFGSTTNAASLRSAGYDVIDTAYSTGSYQRFFVIPGAIGDNRTASAATIYGWTSPGGAHNLGQQVATWFDFSNTSQDWYALNLLAVRQAALAERTWNTSATTATFATFKTRVDQVGTAPLTSARPTATTSDAQAVHRWALDAKTSLPANNWTTAPTGYADSAGSLWGVGASGQPSSGAAGIRGTAVSFSAGANQQINIGDGDSPGSWTVSAWVRKSANSTDTTLVDGWDSALKIDQYNTANLVGFTQFGVKDYSFNYALPLNAWTHLAFVSNAASGTTSLYVNGSLQGAVAGTVPLPAGSLGGRRAFGGSLDEVAVFNQALSASQVQGEYARTSNLALGRPATASSEETASFPAGNAVDGSSSTRWSSLRTDPQWLSVDLGSTRSITGVSIAWEAAYASAYQIQVSADGTNWSTISTRTSTGGTDVVSGLSGSGRYVRILCTARGTTWGDSIWELQVFGS